ncbi:MAG: hypothetical protein JNM78_01255 [Cyclobacteriaceae bacterium]|nr:hypothetical protein [Cyclobacteriaceae bacterium]
MVFLLPDPQGTFMVMKVSGEYTYKNSLSDKPCTAILTQYNLTIQSEGQERIIPYANILTVRLCKSKKKFSAVIQPDGQQPITITNQFYLSHLEREDRSHQYTTFIRILHFHLKDKSTAEYTCGKNIKGLLIWACSAVVIAFIFSLVLELLQLSPINSNILAVGLSLLAIGLIIFLNWGRLPNVYRPENIPLQFLPQGFN